MEKSISKNLNRRTAVKGLAGLAGVSIVAVAATRASGKTPDLHPEWQRELHRLEKEWLAANDADGSDYFDCPECLAIRDRLDDLKELFCLTPATTAAGVAAQVEYLNSEMGYYITESVCHPETDLLNTIQSGLKGLAS